MSMLLEAAAREDAQRCADLDREDGRMNLHLHPVFRQALAPFAPPAAHHFKRESTGCGLEDTTTPTCSCGWKGRPVEGWRDSQSTELAAQEYQHRMEGITAQQLRDGACL